MKEKVIEIIQSYSIGDNRTRVALVTFSNQAQVVFNLGRYTDLNQMISFVNNVQRDNNSPRSNLAAALRVLRSQVFMPTIDRPGYPNIVYIIMGETSSLETTEAISNAAQDLRDQVVGVIGVGFSNGNDARERRLSNQLLSVSWTDRYWRVYDFPDRIQVTELRRLSGDLAVRGESFMYAKGTSCHWMLLHSMPCKITIFE